MNRLKEKILDSTGGIRGLIFLCVTVSSMVIVLVLLSPHILYPSSPTTATASPRSSKVIQRPSEESYAKIEEILRQEELNRKLESLLEKLEREERLRNEPYGLSDATIEDRIREDTGKDFIKLEELKEKLDAILEGRY